MVMSGDDRSATAQHKALLLLQRERELYDLRRLRDRAEEWLSAMHALRPRVTETNVEECSNRTLDLLIDEMGFEAAAVLQYEGEAAEPQRCIAFPKVDVQSLCLRPDTMKFLDEHPTGLYSGETEHPLAQLVSSLSWKQLLWYWSPPQARSHFLILTGRSARTALLHVLTETDAKHFHMFASHCAALLSGSLLMRDLRRERQELQATNQRLDNNVRELERAKQQVVESSAMVARASRQAGMAEVATGILHNVGNALNGVATCADVTQRRATDLEIEKLQRLVELLEGQTDLAQFFAQDERAPTVVPYLHELARRLEAGRGAVNEEVGQLQVQLDHIRGVVSRQQQFAKHGMVEKCSLSALMEDALILAKSSRHDGRIDVRREYGDVADVLIDKHRVLQILVNLMANALHSLTLSPSADKVLSVRILPDETNVALEVADNGVGIAPEVAVNIFRYGFTTNPEGHGFGLHTSKLTAGEIGGDLSFTSSGVGTGATFRLTLPLDQHDAAAATQAAGAFT